MASFNTRRNSALMADQAQQILNQRQEQPMAAQPQDPFAGILKLLGQQQNQQQAQQYRQPDVGDIYNQGMNTALNGMGNTQQANANRVAQANAQEEAFNNQELLANMGQYGQNARFDSGAANDYATNQLNHQNKLEVMDKMGPLFASMGLGSSGSSGGSGGFGGFQTNYGASSLPGGSPFARNPYYQQGVDRPVDGQSAGPSPFTGGQPTGNISSPGFMGGAPSSSPQTLQSRNAWAQRQLSQADNTQSPTGMPASQSSGATGWASLPGYNNGSFSGGTEQQVRTAANQEYGGLQPYKNPNGNFTAPKPKYGEDKGYARRLAMQKQQLGNTGRLYAANKGLT